MLSVKKPINRLLVTLILVTIILVITSSLLAISLRIQRNEFFEQNDILYEEIRVPMEDGATVSGIKYIKSQFSQYNNNSVPTILMLNGINSKKEDNFYKAVQLVNKGYAVFSIEQRGHGESTGPSSFLLKEPNDMIQVLNHIEDTYSFVNFSHFGLLAFSYGGGVGAILQALDDRIYSTVLYHPLSSLDSLLYNLPLQNLIGTTPTIENIENVQDAYELANENNTQNLLLIHGLNDKLIFPLDSIQFYSLINGENRTDIQLKLRSGLDHSQNEKDETSLLYSLLWFDHFYENDSINILDLDSELSNIDLIKIEYPDHIFSELLSILSSILLFFIMSYVIIKKKISPKWKELPFETRPTNIRENEQNYRKMIIYRSVSYISITIIVGGVCLFINSSLLYGYFILLPLISTPVLMFFPSEFHNNWRDEWKKGLQHNRFIYSYNLLVFLIPLVAFLILYNINADIMFKPIIPIINNSLLPYILVAFGSGLMDYAYLREFKPKHIYILLIIRPLSLLIFLVFIPIPPYPLLGGLISHILFIILFGIITLYFRQLTLHLSKIFKNGIIIYSIILFPLLIFFVIVFFRII